jgi:hypothetical protein
MSTSGLKAIAPVPTAADFLDIVLSKTQRKTPTASICTPESIILLIYRPRLSTRISRSAEYATSTCARSSLHKIHLTRSLVLFCRIFLCLTCVNRRCLGFDSLTNLLGSPSFPFIAHECTIRQKSLQASARPAADRPPFDRPCRERLCPSTKIWR